MVLNIKKFNELTNGLNNKSLCLKLKISRTQLWRILNGANVGEKFISNFKNAFPDASIDIFFRLSGA